MLESNFTLTWVNKIHHNQEFSYKSHLEIIGEVFLRLNILGGNLVFRREFKVKFQLRITIKNIL